MKQRYFARGSCSAVISLALAHAGFSLLFGSCASEAVRPATSTSSRIDFPAQEEASPDDANVDAADRTGAIVMGRVITKSEIEKLAEGMKKKSPDTDDAILFRNARSELAVNALLAETAKMYLSQIPDDLIIKYWAKRLQVEEKVIVEDLDTYRDQLFIAEYLNARMGRSAVKGVSPDYADLILVTVTETRNLYNRLYRSDNTPAVIIRLAQFIFPRNAFPEAALMELSVGACIEKLKEGPIPEADLESLAKTWKGSIFKITEVPNKGECSLRAELLEFARAGATGDVSPPIPLENLVVVEKIIDRIVPKIPSFDESQNRLKNRLVQQKELVVQDAIVRELISRADFWPPDLFERGMRTAPPASAQPAGPKNSNGSGK